MAIVVCRELPLARRYYQWLLFAPSDSRRWEQFINRLVKERHQNLLELARELRPKEFAMITAEDIIEKIRAERSPEEQAEYEKADEESYKILIGALAENPERFAKTLANLPEAKRLAIMAQLKALLGNS